MKPKYYRHFLLLFFVMPGCTPTFSQQVKDCDSMIRAGVTAMQQQKHTQSLALLTEAKRLAERKQWSSQLFLALNNIGANYLEMDAYGMALTHFLQAYKVAHTALDSGYEMTVLNNIAILYSKQEDYRQSKTYFLKAYTLASERKTYLQKGMYALNLGHVYTILGEPATARHYFKEGLLLLKKQSNLSVVAEIGLAKCDLSERKYALTLQQVSRLLQLTPFPGNSEALHSLQLLRIECLIQQRQWAEAQLSAVRLLRDQPNWEVKHSLYQFLSTIASHQQAYQEALAYKDSVLWAYQKREALKNLRLYENRKLRFEWEHYKNETRQKEQLLYQERKALYLSIGGITVIALLVIWLLRNRSLRHRQNKIIAENKATILELEHNRIKDQNLLMEKQWAVKEAQAHLEQERLKHELEVRNRKLSAKALYLTERSEMITHIIHELRKNKEDSAEVTLKKAIRMLQESLQSEDEWHQFITHFEEVNHHFLQKLKALHPELTSNDIRFIAYLYMNLSTKEVATLLNITPEAVRKRKERLAQKMGLSSGLGLFDYLCGL